MRNKRVKGSKSEKWEHERECEEILRKTKKKIESVKKRLLSGHQKTFPQDSIFM